MDLSIQPFLWISSSMRMSLRRTMKSACISNIKRACDDGILLACILLSWFLITFDLGRICGKCFNGSIFRYVRWKYVSASCNLDAMLSISMPQKVFKSEYVKIFDNVVRASDKSYASETSIPRRTNQWNSEGAPWVNASIQLSITSNSDERPIGTSPRRIRLSLISRTRLSFVQVMFSFRRRFNNVISSRVIGMDRWPIPYSVPSTLTNFNLSV